MRAPVMTGVIARRILVNYRADPDVLRRLLPAPFRPKLVSGEGMAGICVIRLAEVRPRGLPAIVGVSSENMAHRIAVEWDDGGARCEGVYIPRRDTSSWLNALAKGRLFPGEQHHARFDVVEDGERFHVAVDGDDGRTHVAIDARVSSDFAAGSIFSSLEDASRFFQAGATGHAATSWSDGRTDGVVLRVARWAVEPLAVERVESSFFEDPRVFPAGTTAFDCALLMRDIAHEWHAAAPLSTANGRAPDRRLASGSLPIDPVGRPTE